MRNALLVTFLICSLGAFAQPNNGFISLTGDSSYVEIQLTKSLGLIDKTFEFFFETCDNGSSYTKMGLIEFPLEGIKTSITINSAGNQANIFIEKTANPAYTDVFSAPIYRHNNWNHFALQYSAIDSTVSLFFNGDSLGVSDSAKLMGNSIHIGNRVNSFLTGNINQVRISVGSVYTNGYTIPTLLNADRTTDNLFEFNAVDAKNRSVSVGNVNDTAYLRAGAQFFEGYSISADTGACLGDTIQLFAAGGDIYKWTSKNSIISDSIQNPQVVASQADTLNVLVSNNNGCAQTLSTVLLVEPKPNLNLGNDTIVCPGEPVLLNPGPFASYKWSDGGTDSARYVLFGNQWLEVKNSVGCSATDTINVDNYPAPSIELGPDTLLQTGFTMTLSLPTYFASYRWSTGEKTSSILATLPLFYSVTVTDTNGCTATDAISVNYPPQSISEVESDKGFKVYPNPTTGKITLDFMGANETNRELLIFNAQRTIVQRISETATTIEVELNENLRHGIYFLTDKNTGYSVPITLQR